DLIDAGAPAQRRRALQQLDRGLSQRLDALRGEILELEALLAYEIDFPEEDEDPVRPERVTNAWRTARERVARLLRPAPGGERVGIEVSWKYLEAADLVLYCEEAGDAGKGMGDAFVSRCRAPVVIVRTKSDLPPSDRPTVRPSDLRVSVVTGDGLTELRHRLA